MKFNREDGRIYAKNENDEIIAEVTFPELAPGVREIDHTFVDASLKGQGIGAKLMEAAYDQIKGSGSKAVPVCSFAVKWYAENPEKNDIVKTP
jgi:predicted GNAT family acetyltransferase